MKLPTASNGTSTKKRSILGRYEATHHGMEKKKAKNLGGHRPLVKETDDERAISS